MAERLTTTGQGWGLDFYDCIINNDLARLEILAEQHKIDLNAKFTEVRKKNHLDLSPIHLVAYKGYTGMLQFLYDMDCDIRQTTGTLRRTAFHFAVLRHKMACFHKLLSFGVNPDPRDTFGNSPCHYAAEDGACDILDVLLKQNIDLNAQDITLKTPLMKATRNGKIEAVKRLLSAGCSLNIRDKNRDTALHFAARHGGAGLVAALVNAGSDANTQNQWGHTPLMEAVCYNNKDATEKLLKASCDVNMREFKGGETALHVAVRKNYHVIIEQLLATGKVMYVYNYQGELAAYDTVINQKLETLKILLYFNYDLDRPVKLDYDGTGGKTAVKIALDRGHFDFLRLLAQVGFVLSYLSPGSAEKSAVPRTWLQNLAASKQPGQGASGGSCGSSGGSGSSGGQAASSSSSSSSSGSQTVDVDHTQAVQKFLAEVKPVRSLKQMARKIIRKQLGFDVHRKVRLLPLPRTLNGYITLQDIL